MTRERSLALMRSLTVEERQNNITVGFDLRDSIPTFLAADRDTGQRLIVDVRTYDERVHMLLEDQ